MRKLVVVVLLIMSAATAQAAPLQTEDQKTLYALGVHLTQQLSVFNLSVEEYEFVKQGMTDAIAGKKLEAAPDVYGPNINALAQARVQAASAKQKESAKAYLENAAKEKGAQKTASGLIYQEIKAGAGAKPKAADTVKVHYTGAFVDGKVFDSSVQRGAPAEFPLGQVIPCWTEGVGMMKVGGKARLVCPSDIAYGDQGRQPVIPGGATLVFDVELLEVKPAAVSGAPAAAKPAVKK